jgi:probable HAF family extracellular repeat protein
MALLRANRLLAFGVMTKSYVSLLVGAMALGLLPLSASAENLFAIQDLGTLGGPSSSAAAINDYGQVVGTSVTADGFTRAFVYAEGSMYDLGTLGGDLTAEARGINNRGQVVGVAATAGNALHAFLFEGGVMQDLGTLGGSSSAANAINDAGQVVGEAALANGQTRAFVYAAGSMIDLGALGRGATSSAATGINNLGRIIGTSDLGSDRSPFDSSSAHPFVFAAGTMVDLRPAIGPTLDYISPRAINDADQIVGGELAHVQARGVGFIFSGGAVATFSIPVAGSFLISGAEGDAINAGGLIVGYAYNDNNRKALISCHGLSWDLNDLVDLSGSGFVNLERASGVNNAGEIVGTGKTTAGVLHAYLLTPIAR